MKDSNNNKHVFFSFSEWDAPIQVQYDLIIALRKECNDIDFIIPDRLIARDPSDLSNPKLRFILRKKSNMQQLVEKLSDLSFVKCHRVDYSRIDIKTLLDNFNFPFLLDLEFINNIKYDGFFIGNEILSTLSNYYNLALFNNVKFNKFAVRRMLHSYLSVYLFALEFLRNQDVNFVYVFNGRLIHERAVINACLKLGIPFNTYEIAEKKDSYVLTQGEMLDIENVTKLMGDYFIENFTVSNISEINSWYEGRASNSSKSISQLFNHLNLAYIEPEVHKLLISEIVLTFFAGSVDELNFINHSDKQIFQTQEEAFTELYNQVRKHNKNIKIIVRSHPRMKNRPKREQFSWSKFLTLFEDVYEIKPNSSTDSYELLRLSDFIVVFDSTMGIESRYFNKKTLIMGDPFYSRLPGLSPVKNLSDIQDFLKSRNVVDDRTGINMFGFYMSSFGTKYENYLKFKEFNKIINSLLKFESYLYLKKFAIIHYFINLNYLYQNNSRK